MSQCADNFQFDITAWKGHHDFDMLAHCLKLAFGNNKNATHWSQEAGVMAPVECGRSFAMWKTPPKLILHWYAAGEPNLTPFLSPVGWEAATVSVKAWLDVQDYANEPDHDGDNSKGWRIFNEAWGHIGTYRGAICAIEPAWLMHGK
jgi:hypothetical protein